MSCPKKKDRPIAIIFQEASGQTGTSLGDKNTILAGFIVRLQMDGKSARKYLKKDLTIKDLEKIIKNRL